MSTTAGYSGTPLPRKLGVTPDVLLHLDLPRDLAPDDLAHLDLGEARRTTRLPRETALTLLFTRDRARLERRLPVVLERLTPSGAVWVCWPKRSSGIPTDLDGNVVREVALAAGVVDVKVAAVDGTWSGLKLVRRLRDR